MYVSGIKSERKRDKNRQRKRQRQTEKKIKKLKDKEDWENVCLLPAVYPVRLTHTNARNGTVTSPTDVIDFLHI